MRPLKKCHSPPVRDGLSPEYSGKSSFFKIVLNFVPTIRDAFPIRDGLRRAPKERVPPKRDKK